MKNSEPLISIIIPTFNVEAYLSNTLDSVLAQEGYSNFEILIVDDNSTDNTLNIITRYASRDSRIRVFINARKKGVSGARNTGLQNAEGEWVTFLDGDDLWDKRILESQMGVLKRYPDAQLISSDFYILDENNVKTLQTDEYPIWKKYFGQANISGELMRLDNPLNCFLEDMVLTRTGILLIKAGLFSYTGYFDEGLVLWEDQLLWMRLAKCVDYMVYVPKPLMTYRHRRGSLTRHGIPGSNFAVVAYKKLLKDKGFNAYKSSIIKQLAYYSLENSYFYRKTGQKIKAIASAIDCIRFDAKSMASWRNCIAAFCFM